MRNIAFEFCISEGIVSNHFHHYLYSIFSSMKNYDPSLYCVRMRKKEQVYADLYQDFQMHFISKMEPNVLDGSLVIKIYKSSYIGRKCKQCCAVLVYCDLSGK